MATESERIEALERHVNKLTRVVCDQAVRINELRKRNGDDGYELPEFPTPLGR